MYNWLLFAHIASVAGFLLAHGASAAMSFRLRAEKTTDGIRSLTELSKQTSGIMYAFIALIVISRVLLGLQCRWYGRGWIQAANVALILAISAVNPIRYRFH